MQKWEPLARLYFAHDNKFGVTPVGHACRDPLSCAVAVGSGYTASLVMMNSGFISKLL